MRRSQERNVIQRLERLIWGGKRVPVHFQLLEGCQGSVATPQRKLFERVDESARIDDCDPVQRPLRSGCETMSGADRSRQPRHLQLADDPARVLQRQPQLTKQTPTRPQHAGCSEQAPSALIEYPETAGGSVGIANDKADQRGLSGRMRVENRCGGLHAGCGPSWAEQWSRTAC